MQVVIDTNVFISALMKDISNPAKIVQHVFSRDLLLAMSEHQLGEIKRSFGYVHKFNKSLTNTVIEDYLLSIVSFGRIFAIDDVKIPVECRDKADNYLLATLIVSKSVYLITGDKDLLCLQHEYKNIITPAEFVNRHII